MTMTTTFEMKKESTMKNTFVKLSILCVALVCAVTSASYAGRGDKAGTSAAPMLLIPVGARDIALGGSNLASSIGVDAIYYNPAGLAFSKKSSEAMFSHMSYIADIGVDYLAVSTSFEGLGALALTVKALAIGDIDVTTEANPDGTGEIYTPRFTTIGLTYSNALTDRISIGLTTNLISEQIDRVTSNGVAFNFGVQYRGFAAVNDLDIGVTVKNIGPQMQYDGPGLIRNGQIDNDVAVGRSSSVYIIQASKAELPSVIELGFAYHASINEQTKLNFSSMFLNQNFMDDEFKLGGEFVYDNTFFIRGGYSMSPQAVKDTYLYGASFGAGINQNFDGLDFTIDYAYRSVKYFDANHVFTLKLGF